MFEKFFLKKRWGKGRKADAINELINRKCHLIVKNTNLSIELLETLKLLENCISCKDKAIKGNDFDEFHKSISEIRSFLAKLEKEKRRKGRTIYKLNCKLIKMDTELNKKMLCENC